MQNKVDKIKDIWKKTLEDKERTINVLKSRELEVKGYIEQAQADLMNIKQQISRLGGALEMGKSFLAVIYDEETNNSESESDE